MDGKRIRAFYANATAWSFDGDAEPHIVAMRERQASEFDAWLDRERATARREGQAEAWDEGYRAGADDMSDLRAGRLTFQTITSNPYEGDRHVDQ